MMNRRLAKYLLPCCILLCGWAARTAHSSQQAAAPAKQDPTAARFAYGGNTAQIPGVFVHNLVFLPVRVSGAKPALFELDSTAEKSSLDTSQATGAFAVLTLPGFEIPFGTLPVISRPDFAAQVGQPYQGTLGKDFFDRVVVVIDYSRQTVQLCDPAAYTYSGKGTSFPLTFSGSIPLIRAKLEISGRKKYTADFAVDTALDAAIVLHRAFTDAQRISAAHFKSEAASYPEIDAGAKVLVGRINDFAIGPYALQDQIAIFSQTNTTSPSDAKIAGAIGADYLRRFTVIFDFPHQRLILEPNLEINHQADVDMSGLSIIAKGPNQKIFTVLHVQQNSPAAKAGVQEGDVIAGIDAEAAADLSLAAIRDLFRQIGHQYKLLIERNGQPITISVQMRRLI
jgi:hypothetical protein